MFVLYSMNYQLTFKPNSLDVVTCTIHVTKCFVLLYKYVSVCSSIVIEGFVLRVVSAIVPDNFEAVLRQYISEGLPDLSVSRSRARIPWGIPVPGDDTQTVCADSVLKQQ